MSSLQQRDLFRGEATHIPKPYKYPRLSFFPLPIFVCPFVSCSCLVCVFCRFLADRDYYGPQEDRPNQTIPFRLHIMGGTPPPPPLLDDPRRFISREAEQLYHESLCNRSFVQERGFPTSNSFFNFTIQTRGWKTLCASPTPGVASIFLEFHSNLPFRFGTTVFVRGK